MPGSLKEQSFCLNLQNLNQLMIYLITKFEDEISKINLENMLWDTLAQKWRKIFLNVLAAWLKSKSKSEIKSMKNHIFWWEVAWLLANNLRNLLPDFISFFSQSTWFSTNHVKCVLWLNKTWTDIKFLLNSTD